MAYDAGFDVVVPYEKVTVETVRQLVQDTMFSRGPKGMQHTCFLIGGSDLAKSKELSKVIITTMFPPFEAKVMIDPRGAYTTAAALVAKMEHGIENLRIKSLARTKVVILAGTGPVGKVAAVLCARLGCDTYITSRDASRAKLIVHEIAEESGLRIEGLKASIDAEIYSAISDAMVVICTGPPRVTLMSSDVLARLEGRKLVLDTNVIPPFGVDGLKPKDDLREIQPGIYGIGAIAVGELKYRVEKEMLKDARQATKGVYDYEYAFRKARKLLRSRPVLPILKLRYEA